jgi:acyl-CoA dehydrogenase
VTIQSRSVTKDLRSRAEIAAAVAAANVVAVDRDARFPGEAVAAARTQRLLGILVPVELGGEGASISDVVDVCYALGRSCASTAMIYAMHQIMVACLVRHGRTSIWHTGLLQQVCAKQQLLASSTTEGQGGGNLRASDCAVEQTESGFTLAKSATVMSYGAEADGILTTARRSPEAEFSDQVLVVLSKEQYRLDRLIGWDTLGMRGTCSGGFMLKAIGDVKQILPESYQKIHAQTMMPVAHLTWSGVWAGVAADAVDRARRFTRDAARRGKGQLPPGAAHLTRASAALRLLRGSVASAVQRFELISTDESKLESLDFQTSMNFLKVNSSELAVSIVMSALQACGLAGYRNDGEFSITRHLRDILSSPIMINNDRMLANAASAALLVEVPKLLRD